MTARHPALTETTFAGLHLRNRLAVAPMSRVSATTDGLATGAMADYYGAFARGGFALVIAEGTYTDTAFSQGYAGQPGITDAAQAAAWQPAVRQVHAAGARIVLQLMHAGALAQSNRFRAGTAGPSAIRPRGQQLTQYGGAGRWPVPAAMSPRDITEALGGFAASAVRARDVGFDGVEIHAANGYLLDQFLTPDTNTRTDAYGGGLDHRLRLIRETVAAVRAATGDDFQVGIRLSQAKVNVPDHQWPDDPHEAAVIFTAAAAAGADYLHLAGKGGDWSRDPVPGRPHAPALAALARDATGLPVVVNGGLHDTALARRALDERHAALLAVGRGALADPDLPRKLAGGTALTPYDPALLRPRATLDNARRAVRAP